MTLLTFSKTLTYFQNIICFLYILIRVINLYIGCKRERKSVLIEEYFGYFTILNILRRKIETGIFKDLIRSFNVLHLLWSLLSLYSLSNEMKGMRIQVNKQICLPSLPYTLGILS